MTHFAIGNTNAIANVTIIKSYTFILVGAKAKDFGKCVLWEEMEKELFELCQI